MNRHNAVTLNDQKQMQICFSIASKASTMTQRLDSYHLMPHYGEPVNRDLEIF